MDLLFAPAPEEVYPDGFATEVRVSGLTDVLDGDPARRGAAHFNGVTTVVCKLLNMVGPDAAYFGQKDAQQALVITRMARDLDMPARIEVRPTVREPDGLAMSSRNAYLEPDERERAVALSRALTAADGVVAGGERGAHAVLAAARAELDAAGIEPEYLELRSATDLSPVERVNGSTLLAVAAHVGPCAPDRQHRPGRDSHMRRTMLKSKIHRATLTGSDLNYVGSITIDPDLLEAADIREHEQVHVLDIDNGARFETYTIAGPARLGRHAGQRRRGAPGAHRRQGHRRQLRRVRRGRAGRLRAARGARERRQRHRHGRRRGQRSCCHERPPDRPRPRPPRASP